jgi:hypothetical protein
MKSKTTKPSSRRTSNDIPSEDLDLFLDTHGWKNESKEVREKVRKHIVHFYLASKHSPKVRISEIRKKLRKLQSVFASAADELSITSSIDIKAFLAISTEDPEFRRISVEKDLRRLADLCDEIWLSSGKMDGGDYRDINARRFANNCYHFLKNFHPKPRVTKKLIKDFTPDLYELFRFGESPGLQRAIDDVWEAHKRFDAGQDPYITEDAHLWFSAPKAMLEPVDLLARPIGVPSEYDW